MRLAAASGRSVMSCRERPLGMLVALGSLAVRPLSELDWHRSLDTIAIINL